MAILQVRGFRTDDEKFMLTVAHTISGPHFHDARPAFGARPCRLERDVVDFQRWDRQLRRNTTGHHRLPIKRLRKLTMSNWIRDDYTAGWRAEMEKNVRLCEDWVNVAFAHLPALQKEEFLDDGLYAIAKKNHMTAFAENKHARDLQQYFSSVELVNQVVQLVMEQLQTEQHRDVVWLEPSCGDGRFLTALMQKGAQHVVGYEIDPRLQRVAIQNVQQAATVARVEGSNIQSQVYAGDFLVSKSSIPSKKIVIAVGNPPFGTKGRDGVDLVHRFCQHTAKEWRARIIAFIVPDRCSRPAFVKTTLQLLQSNEIDGTIWTLVKETPVTDYRFEFNTRDKVKRVRQPSVLQLFVCNAL